MDVSIIIVNYNTKKYLSDCLTSIYKETKNLNFEVIVSDNGSTDGSIEMIKKSFPKVILIENNSNLGFGKANNNGLKVASGKYIFYLNSDTILLNNAIKLFFDYYESHNMENIGALGCNLINKQKEINFSWGNFGSTYGHIKELLKEFLKNSKLTLKHFFLRTPFPEIIEKEQLSEKKIGNVDYICGADLFMKNNKFAKFDEYYFMYFEEVDLQYQLFKNNLSRLLIEGPQIIHLQGGSAKKAKKEILSMTDFSQTQINISSVYYYKKNISSFIGYKIIKFLTLLNLYNPYVKKELKNIRNKIKKI